MKTLIMLKDTLIFRQNIMAYENGEKVTRKTLEVDSDDTIYSVMFQVEEMTGVPPTLQKLTFDGKSVYHDTAGTLAENKMVPTYPDPILVEYTDPVELGQYMLRRNTLRSLGFRVDDDLFPDASVMLQLVRDHGETKMMILLTDYIRMDGAGRKMVLVVEPGDTVASLKEQVRRRRRYPPAMQEIWVSDADDPYRSDRRMDRLDATLADYNVKKDSLIKLYMNRAFAVQADREERGKVFEKEIAAPGEQQPQLRRPPARRVGEKKMQMLVRDSLTCGKTRTLWVDPDGDTVYSVMAQIEDATGVPPILQRIDCNLKELVIKRKRTDFYYDTPGTLADNMLAVYESPHSTAFVTVTGCGRGWHMLRKKTLSNLGFNVDADLDVGDPSLLWRKDYPGQEKMFITVTDHIRMDGGDREMCLLVVPEDTVASLMERVQRRRRYPVAMQEWRLSDAGSPYVERQMDKLDATMADYNVKEDSLIKLYMDMEFAFQDHMERRKANKAKEIAAPGEQQKLADYEK